MNHIHLKLQLILFAVKYIPIRGVKVVFKYLIFIITRKF